MDIKAFYALTYGLYVVSASSGNKRGGCVVNTVAQVTATPAQVSVAINKNNYTEKLIEESGMYCATVMAKEISMDTIAQFGFKSGKDVDKFAPFTPEKDMNGIPYIKEGMIAQFSVKVNNKIDLGTHVMFIGEVQDAQVLSSEEALTYGYYQTVKKGTTPKNAPSYKEETEKKGWQCLICSHIYEGETLPADFKCPICGQGADKFVKL